MKSLLFFLLAGVAISNYAPRALRPGVVDVGNHRQNPADYNYSPSIQRWEGQDYGANNVSLPPDLSLAHPAL
jgi:hypothetical protein